MRLQLSKVMYLAIATCLILAGCVHTAEPIEAWVVDADNGQPISDVVVVANWQMKGGMEGGNDVGQLMVMETVTDKKGRFFFPGWGPKIAWAGRVKSDRPQFLIFKTGYKPQSLSNYPLIDDPHAHDIVLKSEWNGKTIKLGKPAAEPKDRLWEFVEFNIDVQTVTGSYEACEWKNIPKMLSEIHIQRLALIEQRITNDVNDIRSIDKYILSVAESYAREGNSKCGSPKDLFKSK
ncbi:MAG: hypothetical protein V4447_04080 [Pseudomonadota bacterium]